MSDEGLDTVRRLLDAWTRGDVAGAGALADPDVVWDITHYRDWPESEYRGFESVGRFLVEWVGMWDGYQSGVDEVLVAPDGRILVLLWQRGKGHGSGLEMDMKWAQIYTVRDRLVTRIENFDDRSDALRAVGLSD
jgi:ketosteroid isomerase-like protein